MKKKPYTYIGHKLWDQLENSKDLGSVGGEVYKDLTDIWTQYYKESDNKARWRDSNSKYSDVMGNMAAVIASNIDLDESAAERKARMEAEELAEASKGKTKLLGRLNKLMSLIKKNAPYATHWVDDVQILIEKVEAVEPPNTPVLKSSDKAMLEDIYKRVK